MGSEYFINSQELENKVRDLLPSQGGAGAGFDLSASTQIIPIIDLTESAEGSNVRQDLQTAFSFDGLTNFNIVTATNTVLVNNTGYYKYIATCAIFNAQGLVELNLFDGFTSKTLVQFLLNQFTGNIIREFEGIVYLKAGESLRGTCASVNANDYLNVSVRQIADINGNLTNP